MEALILQLLSWSWVDSIKNSTHANSVLLLRVRLLTGISSMQSLSPAQMCLTRRWEGVEGTKGRMVGLYAMKSHALETHCFLVSCSFAWFLFHTNLDGKVVHRCWRKNYISSAACICDLLDLIISFVTAWGDKFLWQVKSEQISSSCFYVPSANIGEKVVHTSEMWILKKSHLYNNFKIFLKNLL